MSAATMTAATVSRWTMGGMCLRPVHFLLPVVPVVSDGGAAAGQGTGNGSVPSPGRQTVRRLRGALFTPGSNRAKYCTECAGRMKRIKAAQRKRRQRAKCHALGAKTPCKSRAFRGRRRGPDRISSGPQKRPSKCVQKPKTNPKEEPMSDNRKFLQRLKQILKIPWKKS